MPSDCLREGMALPLCMVRVLSSLKNSMRIHSDGAVRDRRWFYADGLFEWHVVLLGFGVCLKPFFMRKVR